LKKQSLVKLIISLLACFSAAAIGAYFTFPEIKGWYTQIHKPAWNPPNYLFGPVWTTLYTMMAIALWLVWTKAARTIKLPVTIFIVQLILNAVWSIIFFNLHNISLALIDISLLFLAIIATIIAFWKVNKVAGALLIPYLVWVGIAAFLNYTIFRLN
jgi:benzodiazapine receptor